ncbi:MAG: S8 family serine peptidase [Candidatus Omnitrophica bacterium]|nr:S8 family serine peptidase [Candidatus Omnitrophota bacterium]
MKKQQLVHSLVLICFFVLGAGRILADNSEVNFSALRSASGMLPLRQFAPDRLIVKYKKGKHDAAQSLRAKHHVRNSRRVFAPDGLSDAAAQDVIVNKFKESRRHFAKREQRAQKRLAEKSKAASAAVGDREKALADFWVEEVPVGSDLQTILKDYKKNPNVESAQLDYQMKVNMLPNDPSYGQLWAMPKIKADMAWDTTQGEGVIVAVVDTGIDFNHPDLAANIWTNSNETLNGVDDDNNGFVDDIRGWNFSDNPNNNNPMDDNEHGTHVAGTIAALGNNGIGVIGVAPKAKVMAVKGLNKDGWGTISGLAQGIIYAAQNGADVINNSWGCVAHCPDNPIAEDAVRIAYNLGATIVFAAMNSNQDVQYYSPNNMKEVVTVAAVDNQDQKAWFSNYGAKIDVSAPGVDILSTTPNNTYSSFSGTSMAAPHVSGLAALILANHPGFTNEQIRQALRLSADDIAAAGGWDMISGYGRINALSAINKSDVGTALIRFVTPVVDDPLNYEIDYSAAGPNFASYILSQKLIGDANAKNDLYSNGLPITDGKYNYHFPVNIDGVEIKLQARNFQGVMAEDRSVISHPTVILQYPLTDEYVPVKTIDAQGSALGSDFLEYRLELDGTTIKDRATTPVNQGILGQIDVPTLDPRVAHQLTLAVKNTAGREFKQSSLFKIAIDNLAGWPAQFKVEENGQVYKPWGTSDPIIADLDQDGKTEIMVIMNMDPVIGDVICIYRPDGTFYPGWPRRFPGEYIGALAAGNLTGDAKQEIVFSSEDYATGQVRNFYALDLAGRVLPGWPLSNAIRMSPEDSISVADVDADGYDEVVVRNLVNNASHTDSRIDVVKGDGTLMAGWPQIINPAKMNAFSTENIMLNVGDVLGDRQKEIIVSTTDIAEPAVSRVMIFNAAGNRLAQQSFNGGMYIKPVLGDVDHDGHKEIVLGLKTKVDQNNYVSKLIVMRPDGAMLPGFPAVIPDNQFNVGGLALADTDGDGKLEIVAQTASYGIYDEVSKTTRNKYSLLVFDHNGQVSGGPYVLWSDLFWAGIPLTVGDVNGDGNIEIINIYCNASADQEYLYIRNIRGENLPNFPLALPCSGKYDGTALTDLNQDGKIDIIIPVKNGYVWAYSPFKTAFDPAKLYWTQTGFDAGHTNDFVPPNLPPVIAPIADQRALVSAPATFTVSAADPDNDHVTLAAQLANGNALSAMGANFTDNGNNSGTFNWTPTADNTVGLYTIVVTAQDAFGHHVRANGNIMLSPKAAMTAPADGTLLFSSNVTFNWSPSAVNATYKLQMGRQAGGYDIYNGADSAATSAEVTNIPLVGQPVYVTLTTKIGAMVATESYRYPTIQSAFNITATTGAHGTITPVGKVTVHYGANQVFTIIPATGYKIGDVLIDGVSNPAAIAAGTYTFAGVAVDHTIAASFVLKTYFLSVNITPQEAIAAGAKWHLTSGPDTTLKNSGDTITNLPAGTYAVAFNGFNGFTAPATQTIRLADGNPSIVTAAYTPWQAFFLTVALTPTGAITAGGKWKLNAGPDTTWKNSGDTIANIPGGSYTVSYAAASEFTTPASKTLRVIDGTATTVTAAYVPIPRFSLTVQLSPSDAIAAGGKWKLNAGPDKTWKNSGDTIASIPGGSYTVSYSAATEFTTPATQTIRVIDGTATTVTAAYVPIPRFSLTVQLSSSDAIAAGGKWKLNAGPDKTWKNSGDTIASIPGGSYSISYASFNGFTPPATQTIRVMDGSATTVNAAYIPLPTFTLTGALTPPEAIAAGAKWRLTSGPDTAWKISGVQLYNLPGGSYTVTFYPVSRWRTPANQAIRITDGSSLTVTGTYTPQ